MLSSDQARHGPDFRTVFWFGETFTFTPKQAHTIQLLWEAHENGTPAVGQHTILEKIESMLNRLDHLFMRPSMAKRAWKIMVARGPSRGTVQLRVPDTNSSNGAGE